MQGVRLVKSDINMQCKEKLLNYLTSLQEAKPTKKEQSNDKARRGSDRQFTSY